MAPGLTDAPACKPASGTGLAIGRAGRHHGEILQGLWWPQSQAATHPVPCLVTLPVADAGSEAHFRLAPGRQIEVHPAGKVKSARAARLALDALGATATGGVLRLHSPIPTGLGMGSSTSDVLATLRAVYAACGARADSALLAELAVRAEVASDPLMFDSVVLFAQREGRVLEHWGHWMPEFLVLSIDTDPRSGGRDTLTLPVPGDDMRARYTELVERARAAFRSRDAGEIATVATHSAELHQITAPMRGFNSLCALAAARDALGLQISHSGTIAGMLFHPETDPADLTPLICQAQELHMAPMGMFRTGRGTSCDST